MNKKIGILIGSIRKESFNRKISEQMVSLAPSTMSFEYVDISNLPLYNQDLDDENTPPNEWVKFRNLIKPLDGILFFTPEYNRSIPSVLKNAIDVGSRPYGQSIWSKKPTGIVSSSLGAIGGFGANHHLRQSLVCLDMPCMQQPEAYISQVHNLFDDKGNIKDNSTRDFFKSYMNSFAKWVELNS